MKSSEGFVIPGGLARIDQYWGAWATEPTRLRAAMASVAQTDLIQHAAAYESRGQLGGFRWDGETAVVDVVGTITKYGSSMSMLEYGAVGLRKSLRRAAADPNAKQIMLVLDSPGGSVSGVDDLAEEVVRAAKRKPVIAYCEDLCASAAYWVASQATEVYANRGALVGSIGVYSVIYDDSEAAAKEGVAVHVVKSAEFKGAGVPGAPVTDEQLADWQRMIDDTHNQFRDAVMRGRGLSEEQFAKVATGQVWSAKEAVKLGLIDGVTTYAKLVERAGKRRVVVSGSNSGEAARSETMSVDNNGVPMSAAAYVEKLKGLCPGAGSDWLLAKAIANAPIEEATAEHYKQIAAELAESKKTIDALLEKQMEDTQKAEAQAAQNATLTETITRLEARVAQLESGVEPIGAKSGSDDDAQDAPMAGDVASQINALVAKRVALSGETRQDAWRAVMASHPDLKEQLISEATASRAKIKRD